MTAILEGIDISHHQATVPDLTGKDFVICRATYGATPDRKYAEHSASVRAQGRVLGAYHFARPVSTGDSVEEQVSAFLKAAPDADLWVVDRERDGDSGVITTSDTRKMMALIRSTGRRVGLYASESSFRDLGQDFAWVAHWGEEPAIAYDVWQYRGAPLDLDRFRGTCGALLALGAPLKPWVDLTVSALTAQLDAAEAQVAELTQDLETMSKELATRTAELSVASAEIDNVASAITALSEFHERHP